MNKTKWCYNSGEPIWIIGWINKKDGIKRLKKYEFGTERNQLKVGMFFVKEIII